MKIVTGVDIVKDNRLSRLSEGFLNRTFHPGELKDDSPKRLAGILALKECALKAFGLSPGSWLDIEVSHTTSKPTLALAEEITPSGLRSVDCSVSHEDGFTVGIVVALLEEE